METFSEFIALAGNQAVATSCAITAIFAVKTLRNNTMSKQGYAFTVALLSWTTGLFIRFFWWTPAILMAGPGENYHWWFIEYRGFMYLVSVPLILYGLHVSIKQLAVGSEWSEILLSTAVASGVIVFFLNDYLKV